MAIARVNGKAGPQANEKYLSRVALVGRCENWQKCALNGMAMVMLNRQTTHEDD
jgi:hypothetical protein